VSAAGTAVAPPDVAAAQWCSGRLRHVREVPFRHAFEYRLRMLLLDLDRLDEAFADCRWCRLDRLGLSSFHRKDHLGGGPDLAGEARQRVEDALGIRPEGRVWLLAQPRFLGFGFNPVSFVFCTASKDDGPEGPLVAILLEVRNTPWNERHVYVLDARDQTGPYRFETDKTFHVSPFLPMDMRYRFRFDFTQDRLRVTKENRADGNRAFAAFMDLKRGPLTASGVAAGIAGLPPTTIKVMAAIYWQALRLWMRGAKYHPHPPRGRDGRELPHGRKHH